MDDLNRIKAAAADEQQIKNREVLNAHIQNQQREAEKNKSLMELYERLLDYKKHLSKDIPVFINRGYGNNGTLSALTVAISPNNPLLRRPFVQYRITANGGTNSPFRISMDVTEPSWMNVQDKKSVFHSDVATGQNVVNILDGSAVRYLNGGKKFKYALPEWYLLTGGVIGSLLAFISFLLCFVTGLWGILLGPIAALIVFKLSQFLWLPFLLEFFYLFLKK